MPDRTPVNIDLTGLHILVAEDDPVNAMIVKTLLTRSGAQVTHVSDGQAALDALKVERFDAALLDQRMPKLDGRSVAKTLRQLEGDGPHLPLIALTANATEADRFECLAAGMNDFLTKPLDPSALIKTLTDLCNGACDLKKTAQG